jgi:hypothetical protein
MRYYYYPLCTKDFCFENIFATESLSPICFYHARGFGIDYFYRIPKINHEKALILFNEPPKFELGTSVGDAIKFILAIQEDAIDLNEIVTVEEGIIGYQKTIYLNQGNFKILFFSDKDQKIARLKSEMSLPTKGLKKYENNFSIISESDCKGFETDNIERLKLDDLQLNDEIAYDRKYNYFKGYIYGITAGLIGSKTNEEIQIRRTLQQIINSYAEWTNRMPTSSKVKQIKSSKPPNTQSSFLFDYEKKLQSAIITAENLFAQYFPGEEFSEMALAAFLQKKFSDRLKTLEDAQKYVDYATIDQEIFNNSRFSTLKNYFIKNAGASNPLFHFEVLKEQVRAFSKNVDYSSNKDRVNEIFKNALFELEKIVEETFLKKTLAGSIDLNEIQFNYEKNEVAINKGFQSLDKELIEEFTLISNCVLLNTKFGRGEAKRESILTIVEQVGNVFSKNKGAKSTQLYQYLNNEINGYSLEKVSSVVMKNFVAFVFNPDSIEKLEAFIEAKEIEEKWMAHSFWCAFNGFANTSRNFVKPIFDTDNVPVQNYLDNYLRTQFSGNSKGEAETKQTHLKKPISLTDKPILSQEVLTVKGQEFYDKFIKQKYNISFEQFQRIVMIKDKEITIKELKERGGISKKEGKKLVDAYHEMISTAVLF